MTDYILDEGDTDPKDYVYGEVFYPIVHGRVKKAFFSEKGCEYCGKQVPAGFLKALPKNFHRYPEGHGYRIMTEPEFNRKVYCSNQCRTDKNSIIARGRKKGEVIKPRIERKSMSGYPKLPITKQKQDQINRYIARL